MAAPNLEVAPPPKYWAFISHSSDDRVVAEKLRKRLESFPVPKDFRGRVIGRKQLGRYLRPVFRDRDEFSASASLGPAIEGALGDSACLVVLCSPAAACSQWVDQEIQYSRRIGRGNSILALIVSGVPNAGSSEGEGGDLECFPPSLRYPFEPLAADLRNSGDGPTRGFLKIVAGVLEVGFDEIWDRYRRERRRRRIITAFTSVLFLGIVAFFAIRAEQAAEREKVQTARAENLAEKWLPEGSNPTPLIRAIVDGDLDRVEEAVKDGESLDVPFSAEEFTPLMVACLAGHEGIVTWLLHQGVSPEAVDRMGRLAAHHAARAGQVEAIRALAEHGVDVDPFARGIVFDRPIDWAARDGLLPAVEVLLELGVPIEREVPSSHPVAMMRRAVVQSQIRSEGLDERAKARLEGTMKDVLGPVGIGKLEPGKLLTSPIQAAVDGGQMKVIRFLMEKGGKLENAHPMGVEVLKQSAAARGHDEVLQFIHQQTGSDGNEAATRSLAFHLMMLNRQQGNFIERLEELIVAGAKPSLRMFFSPAAYTNISRLDERDECLRLFLKHGASLEEANSRGRTPVMEASSLPSLDWMIPILVEAGANLEVRDEYERTALIIAAERRRPDAVRALVEAGANIHAEDKNGETALIHACEKGTMESVEALIEAGARIRYIHGQVRENGKRPYPYEMNAIKAAERRSFDKIVEYLEGEVGK